MRSFWLMILLSCSKAAIAEPNVTHLYDVVTEGTTSAMHIGEPGRVAIAIRTKDGAHVSDEAPLKIELSGKNVKLAKEKLSLADSLTKSTEKGKFVDPRFEIAFEPQSPGQASMEAKMSFFICTEKLCVKQTKNLALTVDVK